MRLRGFCFEWFNHLAITAKGFELLNNLNDLNVWNGLNGSVLMKLYNVAYSGNSYKIRLLLAQLGIPPDSSSKLIS
jgi:hypothetical protein